MAADGKIDVLNEAIDRMLAAFRTLDVPGCEVHVAVIAFGGNKASLHLPPTPVDDATWTSLSASGRTPMGQAFSLAKAMLEDEDAVPSRSYRPNLVLVSDGIPTDDWQGPLASLDASKQAQRAMRFAIGIGADTKLDVLRKFAGEVGQVVPAEDVEVITEFFKFVTYSVTAAVTRGVKSQAELPTFRDFSSSDVIEF